jgi:hypothetical protein
MGKTSPLPLYICNLLPPSELNNGMNNNNSHEEEEGCLQGILYRDG